MKTNRFFWAVLFCLGGFSALPAYSLTVENLEATSPKAEYTFTYYGEIPVVKPLFQVDHYLGAGITEKWNTFLQNYTREYNVSVGFTDTSFELVKPSIYKAVQKVNKYYKKALRKKQISQEEAIVGMAHVLDCANVMCFDDNTGAFEEAVKSCAEPQDIVALFGKVALVRK